MFVPAFLRHWFGSARVQSRRPGERRGGRLPRQPYRPCLEVLEDRLPPGTLLGNGLSGPVLGPSPFTLPASGLTTVSGSSTGSLSVVSSGQTTSPTTSTSTGISFLTATTTTTTTATTTTATFSPISTSTSTSAVDLN